MNIIDLKDKKYPELLRKTGKEAPEKLYFKGNLDNEIFENCLAVVGSRRLTSYGKRIAEQIVTEIASAGITIVSGFMYGGDEAAHTAAIKAGGRTIAVMPCGIDLIHPEYQEKLYYQIQENKGLIISEYPEKFPPEKWTYPKRNRIVAGLSKAVLVIEAGLNSGTLITAEFARKFKRKIFSVPGPIYSEVSKGSNFLIKKGAVMVTEAQDILKYYEISCAKPGLAQEKISLVKLNQIGELEKKIIEELRKEPLGTDDLARILKLSVAKIGPALSLLQIKGFINQENNKYNIN